MLRLDQHIAALDKSVLDSPNLCSRFSDDDLKRIGDWVHEGYTSDVRSREKWLKRTEAAMDLAMQIQKDKTFPWQNCSNVAFPLITIAALQFHARAYPAIVNGTDVVRCRVIGDDPAGEERKRADRISTHMSWQLLEQDEDWEEQQDRALINVPIVGTAWKKSYYSPSKGYNESDLVLAKDLVLDYWAKSAETCPRKTHIIPLFRNDLVSKGRRGTFRDVEEEPWFREQISPDRTTQSIEADNRAGLRPGDPDELTPFIGLEQHCELDLDNDGYAEPYIITIEEKSHFVLRIVSRIDRERDIERNANGNIISIQTSEYFTKVPFIPSPDGGIMDVGFGVLIGPLNEAVNTGINQLFDAGTMATTAGGFLGRGAKIRGGVYTFSPFGWNRVDSTGDDLRKSVFPLPVREPSAVLYNLLVLLINYTNRISGSTDTMVGENPGQNTPAETTRTLVEQGQKIYSAIFKRIWRSMKQEFKKLYILNSIYLPDKVAYGESGAFAFREDYLEDPSRVVPVADPNITSEAARVTQAGMIAQRAMAVPGYDRDYVERHFLKSLHVDGLDQFYPGIQKTGPLLNPKIASEQIKAQVKMQDLQLEKLKFVSELQEQARVNSAQIIKLHADAAKALAEAGGVAEGHRIAAFEAALGALKAHQENLTKHIELAMKGMEDESAKGPESGGPKTLNGGMGGPSYHQALEAVGGLQAGGPA